MRFSKEFVLPLLVSSAVASPNLFKRAACNADNCLRAIPTTGTKIQGCSSFFLKTVTACAPIVTSTTTVITALTITTPSTTTVSSTTTLTTTVTAGANQKRDVPASLIQSLDLTPPVQSFIDGNVAEKRAVTACPATQAPSAVPAYASYCSGTSRYSSACSCRGVTETFTTITPAASTTISTFTSTVTAIVPTVVETATAVATSFSTVTVPAPVCSSFILQATSGTFNGQYLIQSPDSWDIFGFSSDRASAPQFSIDSSSYLIRADQSAVEAYVENSSDWLRAYPIAYGPSGPGGYYPKVTATIAGGSLNSGAITITRADGCSVLGTCSWLRHSDAPTLGCSVIRSDCVAVNLIAVPAC